MKVRCHCFPLANFVVAKDHFSIVTLHGNMLLPFTAFGIKIYAAVTTAAFGAYFRCTHNSSWLIMTIIEHG